MSRTTMHSGLLKLELAQHGAALTAGLDSYSDAWGETVAELCRPSPRGSAAAPPVLPPSLDLVLPGELPVRVSLVDGPREDARFTLGTDGTRTFVLNGHGGSPRVQYDVRVVPPPRFLAKATRSGIRMRDVAAVYGSYVAIHPAAACSMSVRGAPCAPCASAAHEGTATALPPVSDVVDVVRAAFEEGAAEFVYFNTSLPPGEDGGITALEPYVRAVKHHFDTLVVAQLHPPRTNRWIDHTYAMGVDAVSYSMEVFDAATFDRRFPGRAAQIGHARYLSALQYAASVFPRGTVWCDLILGMEEPASTMRGIDALVHRGVLPVLAAAPHGDSQHRAPAPVAATDVIPLGAHLYTAVKSGGVRMGRLRDLSTGMTPLEARFFVGDDARTAVRVQHLYRSKLGGFAARSLARFRRRLRVRAVNESLDASGL